MLLDLFICVEFSDCVLLLQIFIFNCVFFFFHRSRFYLTPVRDEEAESQRKAKSRHARQTRRSTQVLKVYRSSDVVGLSLTADRFEAV